MNEDDLLMPLPPLPGQQIPTPLERAWLAGFIDGEGTIGLSVASKTRIISTYFMLPNTNMSNMGRARVLLSALLGRDVAVAKRSTKLRRPIYVIAITNQPEIKALLEYVGPWLVGKRPQGDLMLQYINDAPSRKRGPVSKDRRRSVPTGRYTEKHYEYVKQMKALNRRYAPGEWQDDEPEAPRSQDVFLPTTPDERLDDAIKRWWRLRTGTA